MKYRIFLLFLAFTFALPQCQSGGAKKRDSYVREGDTITVIGEAPVYQGDKQLAKQKAIKDAKVNAVRKLIGEEINNRTGTSDGESLGSKILSRTEAFVRNYDILDEKTYKMDTTTILKLTVRCQVEESRINTAVDALMADIGNPRVMVLISGNIDGKAVAPGARDNKAEMEIVRALKNQGSNVIDVNVARTQVAKNSSAINNISDDVAGSPLVRMGQEADADVLVLGELEIEKQPVMTHINGQKLDRPFYSSAATITYKVVLLWGDGKLLPGGNHDMRGADITQAKANDKAITDVAAKVGKKVAKTLKNEWFELSENNSIILRFDGLDPEEATKFADDLREFTGVKQINERRTARDGSEWEVIYPGKSSMLSEELTYKKDSGFSFIGKKEMRIVSAGRGSVNLSFRPAN